MREYIQMILAAVEDLDRDHGATSCERAHDSVNPHWLVAQLKTALNTPDARSVRSEGK